MKGVTCIMPLASMLVVAIFGASVTSSWAFSSSSLVRSVVVPPQQAFPIHVLHATTKEEDEKDIPSSSPPSKKPWTFGILTNGGGFPPQQLLVPFVKFVTFQVWRLMMNELVTHDEQGRFIREYAQASSESGPSPLELPGNGGDVLETATIGPSRRYRLYLGNPCPWCHRVKSAMALLDLEEDISVTTLIDNAEKASKGGWILPPGGPEDDDEETSSIASELKTGDLAGVYNYCYRDVLEEGERYKGRCTAPCLVDVTTGKIVTNESNDILVLLNEYARRKRKSSSNGIESSEPSASSSAAAAAATATVVDLRPVGMEEEVDKAANYWFDLLWNGAYRCGFATGQIAYDEAASDVLKGLEEMNKHLASNSYLVGDSITEVDVKNFAWVTRHDYAYTVIFKSPGGRIAQYPHLASYVKRLVSEYPKLLDTVDMPDACGSYYRQLFMLNFGRIVPYIPSVREWVAGL